MIRTKIFLSCGQDDARGERSIAEDIAARLETLGFEVYVALTQQTLLGVREGIFRLLENSEYYLFIDFKREALDGNSTDCRGSLFTHQELAIASFLEKDVLAFRESGVRPLDGVARFLQANAIEFWDRSRLADLVEQEVRARWKTGWHNGLRLGIPEQRPFVDVMVDQTAMARYFHLAVTNCHYSRHADNCTGTLESVTNETSGAQSEYFSVEHKWAGIRHPYCRIVSGGQRLLDAFWVLRSSPSVLQFSSFADSTQFIPHIEGRGSWILHFTAHSTNVRSGSATFRLTLGSRLSDLRFEELDRF